MVVFRVHRITSGMRGFHARALDKKLWRTDTVLREGCDPEKLTVA